MKQLTTSFLLAATLGVVTVGASAGDGKGTYDTACGICHNAGVANAPKLGDQAAWKDRIAKGKETLYTSALKGLNAMPPKGGNMSLSDADVKAAVDYMLSKSQ